MTSDDGREGPGSTESEDTGEQGAEDRAAQVRRLIYGTDDTLGGDGWPEAEPDAEEDGNGEAGHGEVVPDLAELLAPPVHWPSLEPEEISQRMLELYRWVVELQHRFPEMVHLPGCWHRHNGLVELLQALHDHERSAFAPTSPPTAAAGWHITFRDLEARLRDWVRALPCGGAASANGRGAQAHQVAPLHIEIPQDVTEFISEIMEVRQ